MKSFLFKHANIKTIDIILLLQQLFILLNAGLSILACCNVLETNQHKFKMRQLLAELKKNILSGKNLYQSFKAHQQQFGHLLCELIHVGEQTGTLETILTRIIEYKKRELLNKQKWLQTLIYPCILICTAISVTLIIFLIVIPHFQILFAEMLKDLPLLTRILFFISSSLQNGGFLVLLALLLLSSYLLMIKKHLLWQLAIKLPFMQQLHQRIMISRFARTLSLCIASGLPLLLSIATIKELYYQASYQKMLSTLEITLNAGRPLSEGLQCSSLFPLFFLQMIKIGEETGKIEEMLSHTADLLDSEIDKMLAILNQLVDPLIMLGVGVLIGGLLIGIYLPIFRLGSLL